MPVFATGKLLWKYKGVILVITLFLALAGGVAYVRHLQNENAEKTVALRAASQALKRASQEIKNRDDLLKANGLQEATDATGMAAFWRQQAKEAFNAGYLSRRCDGKPIPVELRDVRAIQQSGAFRASASVSEQPDG